MYVCPFSAIKSRFPHISARALYNIVCVRSFVQSRLVSYVHMDIYANCVPVRTFGSGTSYDKVWYELVSAIRSVNGRDVDSSWLNKSMLKEGDRVTVEFEKNIYSGVIEIEPLSRVLDFNSAQQQEDSKTAKGRKKSHCSPCKRKITQYDSTPPKRSKIVTKRRSSRPVRTRALEWACMYIRMGFICGQYGEIPCSYKGILVVRLHCFHPVCNTCHCVLYVHRARAQVKIESA